jgi:cellulose synthase/poly-beta-1,6-N-acetylglucosamine synthase-like glycosyltransferase
MMVSWLLWGLLVVGNIVLIPYFLFLLLVSSAALIPRAKVSLRANPASTFLIVIPAHDEEPVVSTVVQSCLGVTYPRELFQVLVIADNCSDQTARLAAAAGARVVERFDVEKKSKGYAIAYLIGLLERTGELDSLDALVIIDADTIVDPDLLRTFDSELATGHDWIQAYYSVANPDASWRTRLMTYALSLFNGVMPLGKTRLGVGSALYGNGMCFSVPGLNRVPWQCHGLVEDMEYAWNVRLAGEKIEFQPDVSVRAAMLSSGGKASASQRQRWEFGRRQVRRTYLAPLLRSKRLGVWKKFLWFCELTIPTMGTLALLYALVGIVDGLVLLGLIDPPFEALRGILAGCVGLMTVALGATAVAPFFAMRLPWRFALSLAAFPIYLVWKLAISSGAMPAQWVRTPRETAKDDSAQLVEKAP